MSRTTGIASRALVHGPALRVRRTRPATRARPTLMAMLDTLDWRPAHPPTAKGRDVRCRPRALAVLVALMATCGSRRCAPLLRTQFHRPVRRIRCIQVGRRGRQRVQRIENAASPAGSTHGAGQTRDRMARVQVSDDVWSAFRAGLGATPASVALGRLVEREVAQRRRRTEPDPAAMREAVNEARVVIDELRALVDRVDGGRTVAWIGTPNE